MRRSIALLCCALFALAPSCADTTRPPIPPETGPLPNSPTNAVRLLEWAWKHRNCEALTPLFTDDFRFVFSDSDSAGNAYRTTPWTREDELAATCNLFQRAAQLELDFDSILLAFADGRPGKHPKWHKSVRTGVALEVVVDRGRGPEVNRIAGHAKFYLVRGDSAAIPPDLVQRGFGPDSTRWWIERWEDETLPGTGMRAHPSQNRSWGAIKVLFR